MTLESIIEAILENYGACDTLEELGHTIPYMKETARVNIEPYTWLEIEKELAKGISALRIPTEEVFELNNDKFVIEEISSVEKSMPILSLDDKFAVPLGIANNGPSPVDKIIPENAKVVGFLLVLRDNFDTYYITTAYQAGIILSICNRRKVPKLKVGDKIGPYQVLYFNKK